MINPKKLVEMARRGQKVAATGRKRRISFSRTDGDADSSGCTTSVPNKGHFVVYTTDGTRFVVPLEFLNNPIFIELLKMSEDEFGLPGNGPIKFPCDEIFMEYIISLVRRHVSGNVEKALIISVAAGRCSTSSLLIQGHANQNVLLPSF
ncbi:auxin-responsive protein SAUR64-like [Magnolia sinica]|uniref:auxin-responsive protein SAUR64-like n=1 Tax=Magnolia sinica TaxID=86752 RepID=UPI00265A653A|nr:auxin-responsive protein SAUR64-like [Magnolia sinica]